MLTKEKNNFSGNKQQLYKNCGESFKSKFVQYTSILKYFFFLISKKNSYKPTTSQNEYIERGKSFVGLAF